MARRLLHQPTSRQAAPLVSAQLRRFDPKWNGVWRWPLRPVCVCSALAMFFFFFIAATSSAKAATFTATLDRDTTTAGEQVTLSLIFEGGSPQTVPVVPRLPNLNISYTGQSSQFSFVNGQTTSTLTHTYVMTPMQPGEYVISSISAVVNNQTVTSRPLKLKVLNNNQPAGGSDVAGKLAYVKLIVPKNEVYVGETFPVEIHLYVQQGQDLQMPQLAGEGFTFGKMTKPSQTRTQVGNTLYYLLIFKTYAIAAKTGSLTLGPAQCSLTLAIPRANRGRSGPADIFDFFSNRTQLQRATLTSDSQAIQVLPLPRENVPATFNGAVGDFTLSVSASPTNVAVGDPITVKIQIAGRGALDSLALPVQNDWREFKTYSPTTRTETSDPLELEGVKTFEQVVVPENAEIKSLPPVLFSFFDPARKSYRTLQQPAIPLTVRLNSAGPAQPTVLASPHQTQEPPPVKDIVHIKTHLGVLGEIRPPLAQQPWFLALQGIPVLAWLSALAWRKQREKLANNPRLRRRCHVAQVVRRGLKDLRQQASGNRAEDFFATAFRLLQEQLGERLALPAASITEAALEEHLRPRGVGEETLVTLRELFQTCNQARYAPQRASEELISLLPKVESALRELQNLEIDER